MSTPSVKCVQTSESDASKLAQVAHCMDNFLRDENLALLQENQYRIQETDYYFQKMSKSYQVVDELLRRVHLLESTVTRLREERDGYIAWSATLERWLGEYLRTDEAVEAVVFNRPDPPLSDIGYDSDVTIMEDP
jgi:hypothetical protein